MCLAEPIDAVFEAAEMLSLAADAYLADKHVEARQLLAASNEHKIWEHTDRSWGKGAKLFFGLAYDPEGPPRLSREVRPKPRMPTRAIQQAVLSRDGHHCRFCGIPVIRPAIRSFLRTIYPNEIPWGATKIQHAAFQCMWLQYDHILPNSRGGASTLENVVITCAPCNFGRMEFTLSEAGLINPLSHSTPIRWKGFSSWDGLERVLQRASAI